MLRKVQRCSNEPLAKVGRGDLSRRPGVLGSHGLGCLIVNDPSWTRSSTRATYHLLAT